MSSVLRIFLAAVLIAAAVLSLRIGYSDYLFQEDTEDHIRKALRVWPRQAEYAARLADFDAPNRGADLRRAIALNPGLSKSWIQLGLYLESEGNVEEAERCFLEAARHDHQFLPAWTLANFYSRRNDAERFWPWARRATEMSYSSVWPIFRLALELPASAETVREQLIPARRGIERELLAYLLHQNLNADTTATRLLAHAGADDLPALLAWIERLIETARTAEARRAWDALSDKNLLPYDRASLLSNADFAHEPLRAGFDWRIDPPDGVTCTRVPGGLRIQFSGKQPETFDLASQPLDLIPGHSYQLSIDSKTVDLIGSTNLRWRIAGVRSPPLNSTGDWSHATWTFRAGRTNRLVLTGQRDPGTRRPEGIVYIRRMDLRAVEAVPVRP